MDPLSASASSLITRRRILGWGGAGVVGAITGHLTWSRHEGGLDTVTPVGTADGSSENLVSEISSHSRVIVREDFLPHLKSAFVLDSGLSCTLTEVSAAQKLVGSDVEFTSFTLLFTAPVGASLDSRIHSFTHRKMGQFELFLSPIGLADEVTRLEAVFTQRV
jgi:hypothetical protein